MKGFHSLKGGLEKFYPILSWGGPTSLEPAIFPFCSPLSIINDQSLSLSSEGQRKRNWYAYKQPLTGDNDLK